jgi:hypothetical protein
MKNLYHSFSMKYQKKQSREKPTRRRYAVAKLENNARHQFSRRPVGPKAQTTHYIGDGRVF